ncbi:MAG: universal stress protein [Deltaproteobacteria bacterium]
MTILCGTDFSPLAGRAAAVAGLMARAGGQRLHLVHAVRSPAAGTAPAPGERPRLDAETSRLRQLGIPVSDDVVWDEPDEALVREAARVKAGLIVLGAVGHRRMDRWLLGSCAERTAREAPVPVLVVRDGQPFEDWLLRGRPLRVLAGCEPGPSSDAAVAWAGALGGLGPLDLVVTRLVLPGPENRRVGDTGPGMGLSLYPDTEAALLEELKARVTKLLGATPVRLEVKPAIGRLDQHLVSVAEEGAADLVVVGSHHREGFRRWWQGSVSSGVLHGAPMSVAVVPFVQAR